MTDPFSLDGIGDDETSAVITEPKPDVPLANLETWAEQQLTGVDSEPEEVVIFDIETGPKSEAELRGMFQEKTLEQFAATYNRSKNPDTIAAKYQEYRVTAWDTFAEKGALSAVTGHVLLIGMICRGEVYQYGNVNGNNEADILTKCWSEIEAALTDRLPIIGHNSNGFDLPYLVTASWILGVPVPREVRQGRYWNPLFRDTMLHWNHGDPHKYTKLNELGRIFGLGQKTEGVEGKDFSKLWFGQMPADKWGTPEDQRRLALEYNEQDLRLTAAIAARMGMV